MTTQQVINIPIATIEMDKHSMKNIKSEIPFDHITAIITDKLNNKLIIYKLP